MRPQALTNFLEGKVHSSNVLETIDPSTGKNNANRYYRTNEIDGYLQDKWQIRPNLSLHRSACATTTTAA